MSDDKNNVSRFLKWDTYKAPVMPDQMYAVQLHDGTWDYVRGEDLLACALFIDQLMSQERDDDTGQN